MNIRTTKIKNFPSSIKRVAIKMIKLIVSLIITLAN